MGIPQPPGALLQSDAVTPVKVPEAQAGRTRISYKLILDVEKQTTQTDVVRWAGIPVRTSVTKRTLRASYHAVRVFPPRGWTVSPAERVVTQNAAGVDFVLTRETDAPLPKPAL
ncbi:MAG: hypothetical protein ACE149_19975 [Armatimonadota bacterium]